MIVLGVRSSTDHIRYAVVEVDSYGSVVWINRDTPHEHRWIVPKVASTKQAKLMEVRKEAARILAKYRPDTVILKVAEKVRGGPSPERVSVEAAIIIACGEKGVIAKEKLYSQLKPNRSISVNTGTVQSEALKFVTQSSSYWDAEIADALVAALRELGK